MPATKDKPAARRLPPSTDIQRLLCTERDPIDFVLPGFKRGTVGGLISPGGVGKSYWALALAMAIAGGREADLTGLNPPSGKVLMLSLEDPEDILAQRLQDMQAYLPACLSLSDLDYRNGYGLGVDIMAAHWYEQILAAATGCRLVIIDTLKRFHTLDENSSGDMGRLLAQLEKLAAESGAAVLYLHHNNKASVLSGQGTLPQGARGSSVLVDNARWVAYLSVMTPHEAKRAGVPVEDCVNRVRWNISKQNYGAPLPDVWYRRGVGGVLVPEGTVVSAPRGAPVLQSSVQGKVESTRPLTEGAEADQAPAPAHASIPTATNAHKGTW